MSRTGDRPGYTFTAGRATGACPATHIAFMSVPLHGHVNPMLGVVAELVHRGHRVSFATGSDFAPLVSEAGATAVGYPSTFPPVRPSDRHWLPPDDDGHRAVEAFRRERDAALPHLAAAYATDRPDLVVCDTVTGYAPVLARAWGVPAVRFSPTHVLPAGTGRDPADPAGAGAPPCIVTMPRSLQVAASQIRDGHVFVGPVPWRRGIDGDWAAPPGRRVALVSLGTTYNRRPDLFRLCARAFEGSGWHVLLATGHAIDPADLGVLPAGVEARAWVPQMSVLARADVFVTAGGTGSVLEGLTHGVPLVVLPQAVEQFVTAARVEALGLGRMIRPDDVSVENVRAAVRAVTTDPGVGANLAAMRAEIAAAGGAGAAADVIEAHLPAVPAGRSDEERRGR